MLYLHSPQMPLRKASSQPVSSHPIPQNYYTPGAELDIAAWSSWGFCQESVSGVANQNIHDWVQARIETGVYFHLNIAGR